MTHLSQNPTIQTERCEVAAAESVAPPQPDTAITSARTNPKPESRIRDHLANERTYLAWMRTAIALIGFGVLIARLRYLISPDVPGTGQGWWLGLGLCCIGLITVLLSTWHYFAVLDAIEKRTYEPNTRWVILFSLVVTLMGAGVLYVLFSAPATVKGWSG